MQPRGGVPLITLSQGFKALPPAFQLYIQAGSWGQKIWLLRPTIQLLFLSLALLTGYIRVLDHWHHPCDAFFGFFQGALMAFWVVSDAMGHLGTGRVCLSGSPWVCLALLISQEGSAGEARLERGSGHGMKVTSAHHNLSRLHPCRFSTSQAMPSPRTTYALCATFLPTSPLCIPPPRTLREPKACPDAEKDRGHPLLSRACAPQGGCPSPGGLVQEAPPVWSSVLTPDQPCPGGVTQEAPFSWG